MTGAARLAARTAARAGAGLVTVAAPEPAFPIYAGALTGVIVQPAAGIDRFRELLADARRNAVLIGPGAGVGPETRDKVLAALAARKRVVLDADALTVFADDEADAVRVHPSGLRDDPARGRVCPPVRPRNRAHRAASWNAPDRRRARAARSCC